MIQKFYLVSDLHLEKTNSIYINKVIDTFNNIYEKNLSDNIETILLMPGDLHNGKFSFEILSKFKSKVVFTPGNHEFWENDYFETLDFFKNNTPSNVIYLNNDFYETNDYILIGSTLWTDVGHHLNKDLTNISNNTLNDMYQITAKKWYDNPENIKKLNLIHNEFSIDKAIIDKRWNVFIEQEENEKNVAFLNKFGFIKHCLISFISRNKNLDLKFSNLLNFNNYSFKEWLSECKKHHLLGYEMISSKDIININDIDEFIYKKLINMDFKKPFFVLSHHLPFLEERIIGKNEYNDYLINEQCLSPIYNIQKGLDYPGHNYFFNISKGNVSKNENILAVIHYNNNGHYNLNDYLINNVSLWCHGHEHNFNMNDYVKGVLINTNTSPDISSVFSYKDNKISLNDMFKNHHKISNNEEKEKIDSIFNSIYRSISVNLNNDVSDIIGYSIALNDKFKELPILIEQMISTNKKILSYLLKNQDLHLDDIPKQKKEKINNLFFQHIFYQNEFKKNIKYLDTAFAVRYEQDFSYSNYFANNYQKIFSYSFSNNLYFYNTTYENSLYQFYLDYSFKNIYELISMKKIIINISNYLITNKLTSFNDIVNFENLKDFSLQEPYNIKYKKNDKIHQKKIKLFEKYKTNDIHKNNFNF